MKPKTFGTLTLIGLMSLATARAELPIEELDQVTVLDLAAHENLVWVSDSNAPHFAEGRAYLLDPLAGEMLGILNNG